MITLIYERCSDAVKKWLDDRCKHEWSYDGDDYGTCKKCHVEIGTYKPLFKD